MPYGGKAVSDDKRSAAFHQRFQRFLNQAFALRIQRTGGFIQDEDGRIFQNRARNGDALALAAGEFDAALAHQRGVTFGEGLDKVVRVCLAGGLFYFFLAGAWLAVSDVVRNAPAEEQHLLGDHGHLAAKFSQLVVARVPAVDQDAAARRIIETEQQGDQGGFSRAAWADERNPLSGSSGELDGVKHFNPLPGRIAEMHILKQNIASQTRQGGWRRGAEENLHFTGFPEKFPHPLGGSDGFLELAV